MSLDAKQTARCDQLFKMGLVFDGSAYVGKDLLEDVNVPALDIQCMDDMQWERDITGRLQREIDRRNALPPLNITMVYNRGGVTDGTLEHYGVRKEDIFIEPVLQEYWRSRLYEAIEARKGTTFLIATQPIETNRVKQMLRLSASDSAILGTELILVSLG